MLFINLKLIFVETVQNFINILMDVVHICMK